MADALITFLFVFRFKTQSAKPLEGELREKLEQMVANARCLMRWLSDRAILTMVHIAVPELARVRRHPAKTITLTRFLPHCRHHRRFILAIMIQAATRRLQPRNDHSHRL